MAISSRWLASINHSFISGKPVKTVDYRIPLTPWIHPPVPLELQDIIRRLGRPKTFKQGESIIQSNEKIDHLAMVVKGVTARSVGDPAGQRGQAIALSVPGHLGFGNLNYHTGRPAIGRYFAVTNAEIILCPTAQIKFLAKQDEDLREGINCFLEECVLTDRFGFLCIGLLNLEEKLQALVFTWALHYGKVYNHPETGELWIEMPNPPTRDTQCKVISCTRVSLDKCLKLWKDQGVWVRDGDNVHFPVSLIEKIYTWLRQSEETSKYHYPETAAELFLPRMRL